MTTPTDDRISALIPIPDLPYYLWQALVQTVKLPEYGVDPIFLVHGPGKSPSVLLQTVINETQGRAQWHYDQSAKNFDGDTYPAAMKPAVMGLYFDRFPQETQTRYLYLDPDVLVTRIPSGGWSSVKAGSASWTDSYTGPKYLDKMGALSYLCDLAGTTPEYALTFPGVGAQYVVHNLYGRFWSQVSYLSSVAYQEMTDHDQNYHPAEEQYPVQAWCSEMYLTQLCSIANGQPFLDSTDLNFIWADAPIEEWGMPGTTFFHNAGVASENGTDFCKITHQIAPWDDNGELVPMSVSPRSASSRYVEAIKDTLETYPDLTRDWRNLNEHC